ncbi:hypothetical protein OC834_007466 [Tilletia horrida]|nr:hypothetical protein OC834_007466 [Tilletia horrida]KAK0548967.1 hypothetical protein OC844_006941 [Tilletia horrida]
MRQCSLLITEAEVKGYASSDEEDETEDESEADADFVVPDHHVQGSSLSFYLQHMNALTSADSRFWWNSKCQVVFTFSSY